MENKILIIALIILFVPPWLYTIFHLIKGGYFLWRWDTLKNDDTKASKHLIKMVIGYASAVIMMIVIRIISLSI